MEARFRCPPRTCGHDGSRKGVIPECFYRESKFSFDQNIPLFPSFTAQDDVLRADRSVYREDAVEMVDFVLQQLRKSTFSPQPFPLTALVGECQFHPCVTAYTNENIGKGKAIVP